MRFFFSGPSILGIRPGVIFGFRDLKRIFKDKPSANHLPKSFIYVIEGEGGKHKIGISADPIRRLSELQTGSPVPLKLSFIATSATRDVIEVEAYTHNLLKNYNTSGEWFQVPASIAIGAIFEIANRLGHEIQQVRPETVPAVIALSKTTSKQAPWIYRHPFLFIFLLTLVIWLALFSYFKH